MFALRHPGGSSTSPEGVSVPSSTGSFLLVMIWERGTSLRMKSSRQQCRYACRSRILCQHNKQPLAEMYLKMMTNELHLYHQAGKSYLVHCGGFCVQHVLENQKAWVRIRKLSGMGLLPQAVGCGPEPGLLPDPVCCALLRAFVMPPSLRGKETLLCFHVPTAQQPH